MSFAKRYRGDRRGKSADGAFDADANVMASLQVDFLSPVDRPAQDGALALLQKRHPDAGVSKADDAGLFWKNGTPGVLTSETDGHTHIIWLHGTVGESTMQRSEGDEGHHDHPWQLTPEGQIVVGANDGHDHQVDPAMVTAALFAMQKKRTRLDDDDDQLGKQGDHPSDADDDTSTTRRRRRRRTRKEHDMDEATLKQLEARIEKAEERAVLQGILAGFSDAQKAYFNGLEDSAKPAFASKSSSDRDTEVTEVETKKNDADPVLFESGDVVVRKSDGPLALAMARRMHAAEKKADTLEKSHGDSDLRKRADSELGDLPGTTDQKVEMLKALDTIPEGPARDAAAAALKAGNDAISKAYETGGSGGGGGEFRKGSPEAQLDDMAKARAEKDGSSYEQAYAKVLSTDEGSDLYAESVLPQ